MRKPKILFCVSMLLTIGGSDVACWVTCGSVRATSSALAQNPPASGPQTAESEKRDKADVRAYTLPPDKCRQAVAFARTHYRLYFVGFAYGLLVWLLVLGWRLGPKYRDWAERCSPHRFVQVIVFVPLLLLTVSALNLPRGLYAQWVLRKYGLSIQSWASWSGDRVKGELIALLFGSFVIWILFGIIRRSPRRWWLYFWLAALPIIVFVAFLEPLVVEPLFFKFQPLESRDPALVAQIEKLTQRAGLSIPHERMFEMNASTKVTTVNAYVTGIGASKRVVVWDTTLQKLTVPQTLLVFGHEMGHYVLGHIPKGMALSAVGILVCLFLAYLLVHRMLRRWRQAWGIRDVSDWAALPVLLLLFSLFNFIAAPIDNAISRYLEHQADQYSLEVAHGIVPDSGKVAAQEFQILGEIDLADPDPPAFIVFWLYSHPPINDRIVFSRTYDPWSKGQSPEFVK